MIFMILSKILIFDIASVISYTNTTDRHGFLPKFRRVVLESLKQIRCANKNSALNSLEDLGSSVLTLPIYA